MKIRKRSLSEFILLAFEKTIDGYIRFDDLIHKPAYYAYGGAWDKALKKADLAQALKRLREKGLVKYDYHKTEPIVITLSNAGKDALGDLALLEKKWDGKYRIVFFDIPESKRVIRDLFRRRLIDWGFKSWQKSVWITKNDVTDRLRKLISKLGILDWVTVLESNDPSLQTLFGRSAH